MQSRQQQRMSSPSTRDLNNATQWVHSAGFRYLYVFIIAATWVLGRMFVVADAGYCWSGVLVIHNVLTFVLLHWIKGTPEVNGVLADDVALGQTFWEQLEGGYLGTPTRRFLAFAPIALFFVTLAFNAEHDGLALLCVNAVTTLAVLAPKTEALFGRRLFGINE